MTPQEIQRMFEEMGLGTEEQRAAQGATPEPDVVQVSETEPTEMIFIRTDSVSFVQDEPKLADLA